ncbi:CBS domain-containing protein [soil metagenome]
MRASEVMTPDVAVLAPDATVREAAQMMDQLNVGVVPVCEGHTLVGIITDRDITIRCTAAGMPFDTPLRDVMTTDVSWCAEDDPVAKVEEDMARLRIRRMPVVDRAQRLVGIVALGDLAADRVPGTEGTLRAISLPAEPDRTGGY